MNETEEHRQNTIPHSNKIHSVVRHLGQQQPVPDTRFKQPVVWATALFFFLYLINITDPHDQPTCNIAMQVLYLLSAVQISRQPNQNLTSMHYQQTRASLAVPQQIPSPL